MIQLCASISHLRSTSFKQTREVPSLATVETEITAPWCFDSPKKFFTIVCTQEWCERLKQNESREERARVRCVDYHLCGWSTFERHSTWPKFTDLQNKEGLSQKGLLCAGEARSWLYSFWSIRLVCVEKSPYVSLLAFLQFVQTRKLNTKLTTPYLFLCWS